MEVLRMILGGQERGHIGKRVKELLFAEQKGRCMYCGIQLGIKYFNVDHKTPVARDGGGNVGNLQLLCGPCNRKKRDLTDGEFRRIYKLTPSRQAKGPPTKVTPQDYFDSITKARNARNSRTEQAQKTLDGTGRPNVHVTFNQVLMLNRTSEVPPLIPPGDDLDVWRSSIPLFFRVFS